MPSGKSILLYIGGFLVGSVAALMVLLWILLALQPAYRGEEGLALVGMALIGSPIAVIVGGTFGIVLLTLAKRRPNPGKFISLGAGTVVLALAALFLILPLAQKVVAMRYQVRFREQVNANLERAQVFIGKTADDINVQVPHDKSELPRVLGPMMYPGSQLVSWIDTHEPYATKWEIITSTADHPDDVFVYYMSVLPHGIAGRAFGEGDGPAGEWSVAGRTVTSRDGRETHVYVEGNDLDVKIRFVSLLPLYVDGNNDSERAANLQNPWPDRETYLATVREAQAPRLAEMRAKHGESLYPSATLLWADLTNFENVDFNTNDDMETVMAFYASKDIRIQGTPLRQFIYSRNPPGPEFSVFPIPNGTRIHFRIMR